MYYRYTGKGTIYVGTQPVRRGDVVEAASAPGRQFELLPPTLLEPPMSVSEKPIKRPLRIEREFPKET